MALYSGVTGALKVKKGAGTQSPACVASFSVDLTTAVAEAQCLGSEFTASSAGVQDWTASFDGSADFSKAGNKELLSALLSGSELTCVFELDSGTYLTGNGFLESYSVSLDAEGVAEVSGSIVGNGGITPTLPSLE